MNGYEWRTERSRVLLQIAERLNSCRVHASPRFATRISRDALYFPTGQVRDSRRITRYTLRIVGPFAKRASGRERRRGRKRKSDRKEERERGREGQRERLIIHINTVVCAGALASIETGTGSGFMTVSNVAREPATTRFIHSRSDPFSNPPTWSGHYVLSASRNRCTRTFYCIASLYFIASPPSRTFFLSLSLFSSTSLGRF